MDKSAVGYIGLGRMGKNIVLHLLEQGIKVVGYNRTTAVTQSLVPEIASSLGEQYGGYFVPTENVASFLSALPQPRIIILMVKAGEPVDVVITELLEKGLTTGDTLVDGGNSFFKDSKRRAEMLKTKGITYVDCGTSGGLEGARYGACLMLGGEEETVMSFKWLWDGMANLSMKAPSGTSPGGWSYFGPSGAGHFVKMVHNGVEYGIDQAIGEGFDLLAHGPYALDLAKVAHNWTQGSVVRGWLMDLLSRALQKDSALKGYSGVVGGGETGRWTVSTGQEHNVPQAMLVEALRARERSVERPTMATKVVAALRYEYGAHVEPPAPETKGISPQKVYIGADHRGFQLKEHLRHVLEGKGHTVVDVGPTSYDPNDDFPDVAIPLGQQVVSDVNSLGILLCGSAAGVCFAVNKVKGIRAATGYVESQVASFRAHDDVNVLCLSADITMAPVAESLVDIFLTTPFKQEEKYIRRIQKVRTHETSTT